MTGKRRADRKPRNPTPPTAPSGAPAGAPAGGLLRKSRRDLRAQRRHQRRRRGVLWIAAIVVGVVAAAAAIGFGVHRATSGSSQPQDPETTLLVSLRGSDGTAAASLLAAHDAKQKQGFELLVPARLITDVCGYGTQQFGQILALPGGEALARRTLSMLLGNVSIDGSWTLTPTSLSRLVDAVGGVTVDIDANVTKPGPGGTTVVLLQPGNGQHLDGARAAAYASYRAPGDDATATLSRFQSVFQAAVDALPSKTGQVQNVLGRIGAHTTLPPEQLATMLTALARDQQASSLLPVDLPTKTIDTGGGSPSYRVDQAQLTTLVRERLAASLPPPSQLKHVSVLIENGAGTPGLVLSACDRLLPAGYGFAGSGNAPNFNYAKSQVIVFDSSVTAARVGDEIARLLRLPLGDVVASTQGQNVADVVVILGRDYRP